MGYDVHLNMVQRAVGGHGLLLNDRSKWHYIDRSRYFEPIIT